MSIDADALILLAHAQRVPRFLCERLDTTTFSESECLNLFRFHSYHHVQQLTARLRIHHLLQQYHSGRPRCHVLLSQTIGIPEQVYF